MLVKAFDENEGYVKGEKLDELEEAADEYVWKSRYFFRQGCGTTPGVQPLAIVH